MVEGAGAGWGDPAWPCRLALPLLRQGSVELSSSRQGWHFSGWQGRPGLLEGPAGALGQPLCAGLAGRRVWPPNPPTPPGPPPRGSAGVYRKCRTRLGGGWRGPGVSETSRKTWCLGRYRGQSSGYQRGRGLGRGTAKCVKGVNCMLMDGN